MHTTLFKEFVHLELNQPLVIANIIIEYATNNIIELYAQTISLPMGYTLYNMHEKDDKLTIITYARLDHAYYIQRFAKNEENKWKCTDAFNCHSRHTVKKYVEKKELVHYDSVNPVSLIRYGEYMFSHTDSLLDISHGMNEIYQSEYKYKLRTAYDINLHSCKLVLAHDSEILIQNFNGKSNEVITNYSCINNVDFIIDIHIAHTYNDTNCMSDSEMYVLGNEYIRVYSIKRRVLKRMIAIPPQWKKDYEHGKLYVSAQYVYIIYNFKMYVLHRNYTTDSHPGMVYL